MDIIGEVELTIQAYGEEEVIFDCGGDDYFMLLTYDIEVESSPTPPYYEEYQTDGPTVTLQNITVKNGIATFGGAIDLEAGSLILVNCNFENNQATDGGAIYIGQIEAEYEASVTALNTTFTNNYATSEGGAIYIAADNFEGQETSASFGFCTFLDNYQGEDDERTMNYFAGGNVEAITSQYCVFNGYGQVNSLIIDKINQTVYVNGTSVDPFDSVVLLYDDQLPLYTFNNKGARDFNVTFEDVMGGNYTVGVMNVHSFNTYIFDVKFEMIVPNFIISADEVYENLTDAIDAVAENGIIFANVGYYDEDNMEIEIRKSFTLKNFRDDGVVFDGNSTFWFFTIAEGYTVVFDGISFTDGGIKDHASIENYGHLILINCSFEAFETSAIVYNSGSMNILNSTFSLNLADKTLVWNEKDLVIDTVEFSSNVINLNSVIYNNGNAEIKSSNFTDNSNGGNGGAIYNKNALLINGTVFSENEGYNGGVVYNEGFLEVSNSTFEDNTGNGYGGVIFNDGNQANIYNSTFIGGSSEKDGGAIYNNNKMLVDDSTFVGNSANVLGGAIYNNKTLELTKSFFGINYADEFANIYNAGDIQFSENTFDFYDVILIVPDGQYGLPTTIIGTLDPQFNMDIQVALPGFVNSKDAQVIISEGIFEYVTEILPKGIYDVVLNEIVYDIYGNIYYGDAVLDRLVIHKANVYINMTIDDVIIKGASHDAPVLKINVSKDGVIRILFNNKFSTINITNGKAEITLDKVSEGNYTVFAAREGDENYNDAVNTTSFLVREYEGNFIVNSTGGQFDTLREAIENSANEDIIYIREGNYTGEDNIGLTISGKKLTIIVLGDVVFNGNSSDLNFLTVDATSDVTICDVVVSGFNAKNNEAIIYNSGNLTLDGCIIVNNTYGGDCQAIVSNVGNLNITESLFNDNIVGNQLIHSESELIINESRFENNAVDNAMISILNVNGSVKIISSEFVGNKLSKPLIEVLGCTDLLISSEFYNNTQASEIIYAKGVSNLLVESSIFIGNDAQFIINGVENNQTIIKDTGLTDNTVKSVVYSTDKNLSVFDSLFTGNTISGDGALNIAAKMNATVDGCIFANNKADKYGNIYSVMPDLKIVNTTFEPVNVDFSVYDINYGQNETIEGTMDIGTNLNFTVNFDIESKIYSVNVSDNKFSFNTGILRGGDYKVVLNAMNDNSNVFVFDKITKIFTVNRIDPGLSVSIANITQGEKLNVTLKINKTAGGRVAYQLDGIVYNKTQLENLTLGHGTYSIVAIYRGDKNFLPSEVFIDVKVYKVAPNITLNNVSVNYNDEIKINVTVDVADYYTVFLGNKSVTLYVEDNATFKFSGEEFKPGTYEIKAHVFDTDEYADALANATLTVNKARGIFNLSNDTIVYGENATVCVTIPISAYGNITFEVYDKDGVLVYNITQSCLIDLVVPNLSVGNYTVKATFKGDSYYTNDSIINSTTISVDTQDVNLTITVSNIKYTENAVVIVNASVDGEYLVYVGEKPFTVTVENGTGNVSVPDLTVGSYTVNATAADGNYSAFDETVFEVAVKQISVAVSVGNITYGDNATVTVQADVDGDYIVSIRGVNYTVSVSGGQGVKDIPGLTAGEGILVSVTIADGNYSAVNTTTFDIVPKNASVVVSVGNITYGDNATVTVQADVDGDYIVSIRDVNYTVSVSGGQGVKDIPGLAAGEGILVSVTIADGNYSAVNTTTFNIAPINASVVVSVGNITYGDNATVTVQADVDGDYIVSIRGVNYTVSVSGGQGVKEIPDLAAGNQIEVTVKRDDNYTGFNSTTFDVAPKLINISISAVNITHIEDETITVQSVVDGEYLIYVNNDTYTVNVTGGIGSINFHNLPAGIYIVNGTTLNSNYTGFNSTTFEVSKAEVGMAVYFDNDTYGTASIIAILPEDADGNISIYVNGVFSQSVDLVNGSAIILVNNLLVGNNNVDVVYNGCADYVPITKSIAIKRNSTIDASDMTRGYNSGVDYTAKLLDGNGNPLANENIKIKVGTTTYTVKTDSKGVLKFNNKLAPGNYAVVIANPATSEYKLANLTIAKRITGNKDVKIYFADKSVYKVRIVGDDGKYVGAGQVVKINVGGKTYSVKTDKKGYASLKLSLKVKKHTITVTYKGFKTKNKVTVKSVVKPVKKTVKVKKTAKKLKIKVKLKGKKVLKSKKVYLKFKGKTYKAKTNKKGIATFTIPKKVIKKLKKGKKYGARFTYKAKANGKTIKNTAKCYVKVR